MCSHYENIRDPQRLFQAFGTAAPASMGKVDVWPQYEGLFIRVPPHRDTGDEAIPEREALPGRFGLIPHWATDLKLGRNTFNARSETAARLNTKSSIRRGTFGTAGRRNFWAMSLRSIRLNLPTFYVGLLMCVVTLVNLFKALRYRHITTFVTKGKLALVLAIFLPCLVYLGVMQWLGLYVASAIFIAVFMRWQGKFSIFKSLATGVGVSLALFLMFEIWFKVPLIKGPLEAAFGF